MQAIGSGSGSSSRESPGTEQHIVNFRNATFIFLFMHTEITKLHGYLLVSMLSRSQKWKLHILHIQKETVVS